MSQQLELSCDSAVLAMWDFLRQETGEALAVAMRAHLAICPRCRERLSFEREFLGSVAKVVDDGIDIAPLRDRLLRTLAGLGFEPPPSR